MDHRDSYCPYLPLGEPTVRGTGLTKNMGKEDPFELNFSQILRNDAEGIVISGSIAILKYHYYRSCFT